MKEGHYHQYLSEIKTKVDFFQNKQSELVEFTFNLVDEDKDICAKFITPKDLYLIILNLRHKHYQIFYFFLIVNLSYNISLNAR